MKGEFQRRHGLVVYLINGDCSYSWCGLHDINTSLSWCSWSTYGTDGETARVGGFFDTAGCRT